jgi:hypothetical protein
MVLLFNRLDHSTQSTNEQLTIRNTLSTITSIDFLRPTIRPTGRPVLRATSSSIRTTPTYSHCPIDPLYRDSEILSQVSFLSAKYLLSAAQIHCIPLCGTALHGLLLAAKHDQARFDLVSLRTVKTRNIEARPITSRERGYSDRTLRATYLEALARADEFFSSQL